MELLLRLLLAHLIGDFFIQPNRWVASKESKKWKSGYLYAHAGVHLGLLLLLAADPGFWKTALVITAAHLVTDGIKLQFQKAGSRIAWFFADQAAHIAVILGAWAFYERLPLRWAGLSPKYIALFTAAVFLTRPTSFIIRIIISRWTPGDRTPQGAMPAVPTTAQAAEAASLENAGQLIGMLERLLILAFIVLGKWEGVGFLLTAKSIFRFGDLKDGKERRLTEYVLIGTLLSFGIAIAAGIAVGRFG